MSRFVTAGVTRLRETTSCLQPPAPAVLPRDADEVEAVTRPVRQAAARVELDRVAPVDRDRVRGARAPVLLQVGLGAAVEGGPPAGEVGGVDREPAAAAESVDRMNLRGIHRPLLAPVAVEELVVHREERGRRRELER